MSILDEFRDESQRGTKGCPVKLVVSFLNDEQYQAISEVLPLGSGVRHTKIAEALNNWAGQGGWKFDGVLDEPFVISAPAVSRHRLGHCRCRAEISEEWRS